MKQSGSSLIFATLTLVIGLFLPLKQTDSNPVDPPAPTYYRSIQPIVAAHCISCHSEGGNAPFPLVTYRDVEKRSQQIAQITKAICMPPWKPDSHGELAGENRLTFPEIAVIQQWADQGAPAGEPIVNMTAALDRGLGMPDAVLTPSSPTFLPSDGPDFYRCFILPTHFDRDRYLSAVVFQSGNSQACDHALEYLDVRRQVRFINSVDSGGSFTVQGGTAGLRPDMVIGGWGIETPQQHFPSGCGILLPKGSDIVLEAHYHPTGKRETDLPHLWLYFAREPVIHRVRVAPVLGQNLRLPPNFTDIHIGAQSPVVSDISILSVLPYLRRHGTAVRLDALMPDKSQTSLLSIPQWDFGWIGDYQFIKPVHIRAGSILTMEATFSTASGDPSSVGGGPIVTWGDTPDDENAVTYVFYTTDHEGGRSTAGIPDLGGATQAAMNRILLTMFDTNHDGVIDKREQLQMGMFFHGGMPAMAGMEM